MDLFRTVDPDFGEDYSDDGMSPESSEDEIDIILHGTPEQKRKLYRKSQSATNSSSEDDFEKEMNKELQETMVAIESKHLSSLQSGPASSERQRSNSSGDKNQSTIQKFVDDIQDDSDEELEESVAGKENNNGEPGLSNDDLLYDPDMDDEDQKWVDKQRENCHIKNTGTGKNKNKFKTDAILNCPACMTTLCRDCQRHEIYANQYRAMFVTSCTVNTSETLTFPKPKENRKRNWKKRVIASESNANDSEEIFHPVKCSECETVVAVFDKDEIYHFHNVLTSYS